MSQQQQPKVSAAFEIIAGEESKDKNLDVPMVQTPATIQEIGGGLARTSIPSSIDNITDAEVARENQKRVAQMIIDDSMIIMCGVEAHFWNGVTVKLSKGFNITTHKDMKELAGLIRQQYPTLSYLIGHDKDQLELTYDAIITRVDSIESNATEKGRFIEERNQVNKNVASVVRFNSFDHSTRFGSGEHALFQGSLNDKLVAMAIFNVWYTATEEIGRDSAINPADAEQITREVRHAFAMNVQDVHRKTDNMLVLWSKEGGTGKSLLATLFASLAGIDNSSIGSLESFTDGFNNRYSGKLVGMLEEMAINNKKEFTTLKNLITQLDQDFTQKGKDTITTTNVTNYVGTLNQLSDIAMMADVIRRLYIVHVHGHDNSDGKQVSGRQSRRAANVPADKETIAAMYALALENGLSITSEGAPTERGCINLPMIAVFIKNPKRFQGVFIELARLIAPYIDESINLGDTNGRTLTQQNSDLDGAGLEVDDKFKKFKRKVLGQLKRAKKGENIRGVTAQFIALSGLDNSTLVDMGENTTQLDKVAYTLVTLDNGKEYLVGSTLANDMPALEDAIELNYGLTIDPNTSEGLAAMGDYIREHNDFAAITLEELKLKFGKVTKRVIRSLSKSMNDYVVDYVDGGILVKVRIPSEYKGEDFDM